MDKRKIEILREKLNNMVNDYDCKEDEVLKLSEELDELILEYLQKSLH